MTYSKSSQDSKKVGRLEELSQAAVDVGTKAKSHAALTFVPAHVPTPMPVLDSRSLPPELRNLLVATRDGLCSFRSLGNGLSLRGRKRKIIEDIVFPDVRRKYDHEFGNVGIQVLE